MKYLTAEEILREHKSDAHEILERCAGKSIRDSFAFKVFDRSVRDIFGDDHYRIKVLDLGIASGAFVRQVWAEGYRVLYGTDLDDYVKPENKPSLQEFKKVDLSWEKIPWPDGFFDAVVAWCVLPHLENPFHCVREVRRVLAPGGLFIFTAPYLASKPSRDYFMEHEDFGSYRAANNHLVLFPPGVVEKAVLRYFDLVGLEYHFRSKILVGWSGMVRKIIWKLAKLFGPDQARWLAKRWAYNVVYTLKNK